MPVKLLNEYPIQCRNGFFISLILMLIFSSGCTLTSNPENSGGEIIAIPNGPWCEFSISSDGRWLQFMGDTSKHSDPEANKASHQRETYLIDLENDQKYFMEPDTDVQRKLAEGFGPDGLGCFSSDNKTLNFTTVDWKSVSENQQSDGQVEDSGSPQARISTPSRQGTRYHYSVDLTRKPFVLRESNEITCADRSEPVKPDIRVERPSEKQIIIYANDGRRLATHRPKGLLGNTISIWNLNDNQWEMDYSLSPDGKRLAYRISERGLMGFSAPTSGYLINLYSDETSDAKFLGASIYSMEWDPSGNLYACTSHSKHRRVIARWTP
ncbi:hypothetical protein [Rhodohalobacter sp.]|uniref:hypothetical protein n=1 Tax=Rhodohalobacter sp. TaxID=1974210 RepID=UPI002ACD5D89|nr:hypothetical protein [Rhodohalobacter sp.]MDZ7757540.1 hypothetical protein [Rhodohalobacter sp.]